MVIFWAALMDGKVEQVHLKLDLSSEEHIHNCDKNSMLKLVTEG